MGISNLLSCHNSSIVPPRLDPLEGSLWLLPSFSDLTFLDKIVLRDTRWQDALGKMYVMCMYAYVSTPLFSEVWPPPSLLGDNGLTRHFLRILKRPTLGQCSEYQHRTTRSWVAHTSATQVRLGTTNQNGAGLGGRWRVGPDVTSPESVMFRGKYWRSFLIFLLVFQ